MALTTATIQGNIPSPSGDPLPDGSYIEFQLTSWDTDLVDAATVVTASEIVQIDSNGDFTTPLWPNDRGLRGTLYEVKVFIAKSFPGGRPINLGYMEVPGTGTYNLEDLLGVTPNQLPQTYYEVAQAVLDAREARDEAQAAEEASETAEASALAAASAAVAASEASGAIAFYDTKADANAALSGLSNGDVVEVLVDESLSGLRTRYRVESAAYVFKFAFTPTGFEFADAQTFRDDTALTYASGLVAAGDRIRIRKEGAEYEIAAPSAQNYDEASTGGLRAYVVAWSKNRKQAPRMKSHVPAVINLSYLTHLNANWPGDVEGEWNVTGTAGNATLTYTGGTALADLTQTNLDGTFPVAMVSNDDEQLFTAICTGNDGSSEIYLREPLDENFAGVMTAWGDAPNGQHLTQNGYRVWAKAIATATEFESCLGPSLGLMYPLEKRTAAQWVPNSDYAAAASDDGGTFPDRVTKHNFDRYSSTSDFQSGNNYASVSGSDGWFVKPRPTLSGNRAIGMWEDGHGVFYRANARGRSAFLEGWIGAYHPQRDLNSYYGDVDSIEIEIKVTQDGRVIYQKRQNHVLRNHRVKLPAAGDVLIEITLKTETSCYIVPSDWSLRLAGQGGALIEPDDRVLVGMDSWGAYFSDLVDTGSGVLLRRGQVARELERQTGCHCVDKSSGGKTGAWVLHWLEEWIERYKPDVFITDMAINDNTLTSTWTTTESIDGSEIANNISGELVDSSRGNQLGGIIPSQIADNLWRMSEICRRHGVRLIYVFPGSVPSASQSQGLSSIAPYLDYRAVMEDMVEVREADIENAHATINRHGKYAGARVFNRDVGAVYVASGPEPLDDWFQQDDPAVTVTPVDVLGPVFLNRNSQNVAENTPLTFAMRCDEPVTYAITGGADAGLFSLGDQLDPRTQRLELPGQSAGSYVVEVTATDIGGNTAVQTITVNAS